MSVSRSERRTERKSRVVAIFGDVLADSVLDLFELTELAWHDCYNEITPSDSIVDDILLCSGGDLAKLIRFARLAVADWRDLKVAAARIRQDRLKSN
jgi:hypothetical protein